MIYFNEKDVLATVATLHDPLGKDTQFGNHWVRVTDFVATGSERLGAGGVHAAWIKRKREWKVCSLPQKDIQEDCFSHRIQLQGRKFTCHTRQTVAKICDIETLMEYENLSSETLFQNVKWSLLLIC